MKVIESKKYGAPDVFQLSEIPKPSPGPGEIVIRNHATTVTSADCMMRKGKPRIGRLYLGLWKPKRTVLGFEFAGEVVETGAGVTSFKAGDRVFGGTTALSCYAEYVCVNEKEVIATMPDRITYETAAPVNGSAITCMNFLKGLADIRGNQKVLIYGASGALGTYAVQLAKHFGATVTGVCSNRNMELVKSLGADSVIDYTREDFTKNGVQYDIIFDTVGKRSFSECKRSLSQQGIYLSSVLNFRLFLHILGTSLRKGKKAKSSATGMLPVKTRLSYFLELRELLEAGKIKTVIDRCYSLPQMAEAHAYVEEGRKKGSVVIRI